MQIHYDIPRLNSLIQDVFDLTGITIAVHDSQGRTVASCSQREDYCLTLQGLPGEVAKCRASDHKILEKCRKTGKLEYHICRAGLCDAAMPITKDGHFVGYILMGRIRLLESPAQPPKIPNIPPQQQQQLQNQYRQLPVLTQKQLSALYHLLPAVLFESAITIVYDPFANQVMQYIQQHLQQRITVTQLCQQFHVSKNYLYQVFHKNLDCTVNAYIAEQRLLQAQKLLRDSREPVYRVAEQVGMDNYTYFCRMFKQQTGMTPMQYRRKQP